MDTEGLSLDDKESLKIQNDLVEQMGASDLAELVDIIWTGLCGRVCGIAAG